MLSNTPSGALHPFIDGAEVKVSSYGAPWDSVLTTELHLLAPAEIQSCYVRRTTIIQHLADHQVVEERLGLQNRYEAGSTNIGTVHIDPVGSLTGARWDEPISVLFLMPSELAFQRVLADASYPSTALELIRTTGTLDLQISQIGLALLAECQNGFPSGVLYGESLAIALASRLVTCYSSVQPKFATMNDGLPAWRLRRVKEFIEENLETDLSLADLASTARFSEYHFSRMFKRRTGSTPHRYVMERRAARAKELLTHGQMSIKEISARLGFADQAHFTTVFKSFTGTTPKQFREQTA